MAPKADDAEAARFDAYLASRGRKAEKIAAILAEHLGDDLSSLRALDVGCSLGWIAQALNDRFALTVGIDTQRQGLVEAAAGGGETAPHFVAGDGARMPFRDAQFDVAIYAYVYEHIAEQQAVADEIWRVLRPGGVCLFSGPNRLAAVEEHFRLPFLSWLPRPLAALLTRAIRRRAYDVYPRALWTLRHMWRRFAIRDYTVKMIADPARYSVEEHVGRGGAVSRLPRPLLRALAPIFPNYNWILEKPRE